VIPARQEQIYKLHDVLDSMTESAKRATMGFARLSEVVLRSIARDLGVDRRSEAVHRDACRATRLRAQRARRRLRRAPASVLEGM
jgi:hypothetical protein